jgi:hypothetical protein
MEEDVNFEQLVTAVAPKRPVQVVDEDISQSSLPLSLTISVSTQTDDPSTHSKSTASKSTATQTNTIATSPTLPRQRTAVMACQSTQTDIAISHNLMSSISRWSRQIGKDLEVRLNQAIKDEEQKDLKKLTKKQRKINLEIFGKALRAVTNFAYISRDLKTRGNTIVFCTFRYLCEWKPELFQEAIMLESRQFSGDMSFNPGSFRSPLTPMLLVDSTMNHAIASGMMLRSWIVTQWVASLMEPL